MLLLNIYVSKLISQITIQCRIVASESTRQQLWKLMADKNTPLINELLLKVAQHPEFETWRQKSKHPTGIAKELCQLLKTDPRYSGQPSRFYASATALVNYTYKSWLLLMKRLQSQLDSKTYWLEMLRSDAELVKTCGASKDGIRTKATEILAQIAPVDTINTQQPKSSKVNCNCELLWSLIKKKTAKNLINAAVNLRFRLNA